MKLFTVGKVWVADYFDQILIADYFDLQHLNFGPASRGPKLGHGSFGPRSFGPKLCAYKSVLLSSLDQRLSELCRDYVSIECRRGECRKSDRADGTV